MNEIVAAATLGPEEFKKINRICIPFFKINCRKLKIGPKRPTVAQPSNLKGLFDFSCWF